MGTFKEENTKLLDKAMKEVAQRVNNNLSIIHTGDTVQPIYCYEAIKYKGQSFKVLADPVKQGFNWVVELEQLGLFHLGFVKKI